MPEDAVWPEKVEKTAWRQRIALSGEFCPNDMPKFLYSCPESHPSVACSSASSSAGSLVCGSGLAPLACDPLQHQFLDQLFSQQQQHNSLVCGLQQCHLLCRLFVSGSRLAPLACSLWQHWLLGRIFLLPTSVTPLWRAAFGCNGSPVGSLVRGSDHTP